MEISDLRRQAGRGAFWSLIGTVLTRAGSFLMGLILARVLAPGDFGLFAVALAATQLVMVIKDIGVMVAVVQWRGKLEEVAPTATTLSMLSAVALYGVVFVGAPSFAELSGGAEATSVVRVLTSVILVEAFIAVRSAALMRWFRTDHSTVATAVGFLVNAPVAIILAMTGAGAYSFAWGQVSGAVVTGGLMLWFARSLPFRLGFDREIAGRLLRFGLPSALGMALEAMLLNVGYMIIGRLMGKEWLGFYLMAFNISSWVPGLLGVAIRRVSIAGFSRLAERDLESLSNGVRKSVPVLIAAVLPLAVFMFVLAHPLVIVVYGEVWEQSAGVLRWLAVVMVVRMLTAFTLDILSGQGATRATVWMNLGHGAALVPAIVVGAHLDGIRGAAVGQAVVAVLVALPLAALAVQRVGVRLALILPALVRPLLGAVLCAGVSWLLLRTVGGGPLVELAVAGGGGLVVYLLVVVDRARFEQAVRLLPARIRRV